MHGVLVLEESQTMANVGRKIEMKYSCLQDFSSYQILQVEFSILQIIQSAMVFIAYFPKPNCKISFIFTHFHFLTMKNKHNYYRYSFIYRICVRWAPSCRCRLLKSLIGRSERTMQYQNRNRKIANGKYAFLLAVYKKDTEALI